MITKEVKKVSKPRVKKEKVIAPAEPKYDNHFYIDIENDWHVKTLFGHRKQIRIRISVGAMNCNLSHVTYFEPGDNYMERIPEMIEKLKAIVQSYAETTCA